MVLRRRFPLLGGRGLLPVGSARPCGRRRSPPCRAGPSAPSGRWRPSSPTGAAWRSCTIPAPRRPASCSSSGSGTGERGWRCDRRRRRLAEMRCQQCGRLLCRLARAGACRSSRSSAAGVRPCSASAGAGRAGAGLAAGGSPAADPGPVPAWGRPHEGISVL